MPLLKIFQVPLTYSALAELSLCIEAKVDQGPDLPDPDQKQRKNAIVCVTNMASLLALAVATVQAK